MNKHSAKEPLSILNADSSFVNILFHLKSASGINVFNVIFTQGRCVSSSFFNPSFDCSRAQLSRSSLATYVLNVSFALLPRIPFFLPALVQVWLCLGQLGFGSLCYHLIAIVTFREAISSSEKMSLK